MIELTVMNALRIPRDSLPGQLVLMRHGRTRANDFYSARRKDVSFDPGESEELLSQPDWKHTLSDLGIEQAKGARSWIDRYMGGLATFNTCWTSPYFRTRQTAAILSEGTAIKWRIDDRLSEQGYGEASNLHILQEMKKKIQSGDRGKSVWSFYFNGGESQIGLQGRFRDFAREHLTGYSERDSVLLVAHIGLIGVARYCIESWLPEEYDRQELLEHSDIKNGSLLIYSRISPYDDSIVTERYRWRRIVYPTSSSSDSEWQEIATVREFTSQELIDQIKAVRGGI